MSKTRWKIHKFGGSSLADVGCIRRAASIVAELPKTNIGVVVSAMRGATDRLLHSVSLAERDDRRCMAEITDVLARYTQAAQELLQAEHLISYLDQLAADESAIGDVLNGVAAAKSGDVRSREVVAGYGEMWSARLLAGFLKTELPGNRGGAYLDAVNVIVVQESELGPSVQWEQSQANFDREIAADFQGVVVITGYVATDIDGLQTSLGRNGSDHSAAIIAALSGATELSIWTDVDGVMSADPNKVPDAQIIDSLSYSEAMELAYFGAKVIHPQTLGPAVSNDIPVVIRNTFNPQHEGSKISADVTDSGQIKGVTAVANMALVNLEGAGMIGVPGTADRMFSALKNAAVSVNLISQASSEHSICVAVPNELADRAKNVVVEAFAAELESGQIQSVDVNHNQSIIAVVGDGMAGTPGIAARFFGSLSRARVNIRAMAQGSSERNISAVVNSDDTTRALRAAHSGFYLSAKTISVGLIGPGTVGSTFLDQLQQQSSRLQQDFNLDLRVRAIARSQRMIFGERRVDIGNWRAHDKENSLALDLELFEKHVHPDHIPHAAIIDCTASDDMADRYAEWLDRGIHIITPNKKAFSGDLQRFDEIRDAQRRSGARCFYETTVGAALPVITTLRDLVDTGDQIHSVQGIFSGTLAYLFNVFDGSRPFSEVVREAKESGYTEPDPREDLSGMDVARKLTILAREMGQRIELGDFPVQNLVPEALREVTVNEFLDQLADYDAEMTATLAAAKKAQKNLRYIAKLDAAGEASVSLEAVSADHAFSNIDLTDNIVQFASTRYSANPLVIQGPGAGPAVTAGGVFGDLLKLANQLGDGSQ